MRTVRISDLRRGHLRAEFVPKLRVEFFHKSDSEGCPSLQSSGIVRIDFRPVLYICALHAHAGWPPPASSCCNEPIIVYLLHQEPPRFGSRLKFRRTTAIHFQTHFEFWRGTSCASRSLTDELRDRFEAGACVEILRVPTLCEGLRRTLPAQATFYARRVEYYDQGEAPGARWADCYVATVHSF
jgi:hypothetical protein